MNRIDTVFTQLKSQKRKALISYITAGDPAIASTVPLLHDLVSAGANILELGMPFSDPMAEGVVIQAAHERALKNGVKMRDIFAMVIEFRRADNHTPVILMGYLNPVEAMGYAAFADAAQKAGVDGLIMVDLPIEEADALLKELNQRNIALIFLLSPTTTQQRLKLICEKSRGFHYYVTLKGVTGSQQLDSKEVIDRLNQIRPHTVLPIAVGFGIHDAQSAATLAKVADGIVVGSALIATMANASQDKRQEVKALVSAMRAAMDAGL